MSHRGAVMDAVRAQRIIEDATKRVRGGIVWRQHSGRNVVMFEVPVENDLGEPVALLGQCQPATGHYKLILLAGDDRASIYRYESSGVHRMKDGSGPPIDGPHVNPFWDGKRDLSHEERDIPANDLRRAVHAFAERVNIRGVRRVRLPEQLQQMMKFEGGEQS